MLTVTHIFFFNTWAYDMSELQHTCNSAMEMAVLASMTAL
jgi:hypothetical protein